jgi:DNA-binding MarR family transcriptional regulator
MSDQIELIKKILDYTDSFQKEKESSDIKEFAIYLRDKVMLEKASQEDNYKKEDYMLYKKMPKVEFSTLLTSLYRFAKFYVKKAFNNTTINTVDEFGFLASILKEKSLLKNELVKKHYMEISSGSEIIKRLIKNKLIYEYPDPNDGRAKRVSLTETGFKEIMLAFDEMHKVSEVVAGNLNQEELTQALSIFNKLNYFHINIHSNSKDADLESIYREYIKAEVNEA